MGSKSYPSEIMKILCASLVLCFTFLGSTDANSQCQREWEGSTIWTVKTTGTWEEKGRYGYYRVVVYRKIGEEALDTVCVEVLEVQSDLREPVVRRSSKLAGPGYKGIVRDIHFAEISSTTMAITLDFEMRGMKGLLVQEIYLASPNREPKLLQPAKYIDLN